MPHPGHIPQSRPFTEMVQSASLRSTARTFGFGAGAHDVDFFIPPDAVYRPGAQLPPLTCTKSETDARQAQCPLLPSEADAAMALRTKTLRQ